MVSRGIAGRMGEEVGDPSMVSRGIAGRMGEEGGEL